MVINIHVSKDVHHHHHVNVVEATTSKPLTDPMLSTIGQYDGRDDTAAFESAKQQSSSLTAGCTPEQNAASDEHCYNTAATDQLFLEKTHGGNIVGQQAHDVTDQSIVATSNLEKSQPVRELLGNVDTSHETCSATPETVDEDYEVHSASSGWQSVHVSKDVHRHHLNVVGQAGTGATGSLDSAATPEPLTHPMLGTIGHFDSGDVTAAVESAPEPFTDPMLGTLGHFDGWDVTAAFESVKPISLSPGCTPEERAAFDKHCYDTAAMDQLLLEKTHDSMISQQAHDVADQSIVTTSNVEESLPVGDLLDTSRKTCSALDEVYEVYSASRGWRNVHLLKEVHPRQLKVAEQAVAGADGSLVGTATELIQSTNGQLHVLDASLRNFFESCSRCGHLCLQNYHDRNFPEPRNQFGNWQLC